MLNLSSLFKRLVVSAPGMVLLGAAARLLFSVVSLKIISYYAGPSGLAVIGQLQGFLQIASTAASSVTTNGVVKLIAENKDESPVILSSAFKMLVLLSVIIIFVYSGLSLIWLNMFGGDWLVIFILIPVAAFFIAFVNLVSSCFNGLQCYQDLLRCTICFSLFSTLLVIFLVALFEGAGAVMSVVIAPIFSGVIVWCVWRKPIHIRWLRAGGQPVYKQLRNFSLATLFSAVCFYGGHVYLRDYIQQALALEYSGFWYSVTKLSEIYMGIFSVLFVSIVLPKLSSMIDGAQFLLRRIVFVVALSAVFFGVMVFLSSGYIINVVYGAEFSRSSGLLALYVFGDCIKLISWVYLYYFMAKGFLLPYVFCDVCSSLFYVVFVRFFLDFYGYESMPLGYIAQALLSFFMIYCIYHFTLRKVNV